MQLPNIDPVFLKLGPLEFRWYGLMYIIGFACAWFIIRKRSDRRGVQLSAELLSDIVFFIAMGIVLGGRMGYILFYNLSWYIANPLKIFAVWEGGMSFHGGMIGGALAGIYIFRKQSLDLWQMADIIAPAIPVGLFLGRIGNFINGELFGRATDKPWGVIFPTGGMIPRHPSQLYEAFSEGILLFAVTVLVDRMKPPKGSSFWTVIAGYGLCRFVVEFFREPDQHIGFLWMGATMGQLLSLPMLILGCVMIVTGYVKRGKATREV